MSADNEMDPGDIPAYLLELTQIEEMIIARSHVQMMVYRYQGHQYHYSGHCVAEQCQTCCLICLPSWML